VSDSRENKVIVEKWRGLNPHEAIIWAHLRIDQIQRHLNIGYEQPDLNEIIRKLESEATEKEYYSDDTKQSIFIEFFSEVWVIVITGLRNFINCLFRPKKCESKDSTSDKSKDNSNDV
jgi:hypothetical protein